MAQCQLQIIGTGRADATQIAHAVQCLKNTQHTGNAALGGHFINDIRLTDTQLRLGRLQVVEHHGHGAVIFILRLHRQTGQWVGACGNIGTRLRFGFRFRLGCRLRLFRGFRLLRRGLLLLLFSAA